MYERHLIPTFITDCDACAGHGEIYEISVEWTDLIPCPVCKGRGKIQQYAEVVTMEKPNVP